jgi:hypothetical protein
MEVSKTDNWSDRSRDWLDVTDIIEAARECLRNLWNQHYRCLADKSDVFDVIDAYKAIRQQVLRDYLRLSCNRFGRVFVKIKTAVKPQAVLSREQSAPQVVTWKQLSNADVFEGRLFVMIDFFDFDDKGPIDLRYVEMEPVDPSSLRSDNSSRLLAEFQHCEFGLRAQNGGG